MKLHDLENLLESIGYALVFMLLALLVAAVVSMILGGN